MNILSFLNSKRIQLPLQIVTHLAALLPLTFVIYQFTQGGLGADPIRELTLVTGEMALRLLILSLACTPLNIWFGWRQVLILRKPLGLYGFMYVTLHLMVFVWLDYGLELGLAFEEIINRQYTIAGFTAFLLLLPVAATSSKWAMRKLGKNWKRLHRLVYVIGILGVLHYIMLVKNTFTEPIIYAVILFLFLATRIPPVKIKLNAWRRSLKLRLTAS